jgi:hypothetical protein
VLGSFLVVVILLPRANRKRAIPNIRLSMFHAEALGKIMACRERESERTRLSPECIGQVCWDEAQKKRSGRPTSRRYAMWMFYLLRRRYVSIINRAAAAFYRRSKIKDLLCYESRGRYATDRGPQLTVRFKVKVATPMSWWCAGSGLSSYVRYSRMCRYVKKLAMT